jgi:ABC-type ATPase involved in cell division
MTAPDWRRLVAYVPAETGWWADLVAGHFECDNLLPDTIDLGAQFESVGLPAGAVNWDVARLSTGERHRLGLLRAFIKKPQVLLLDEPTASLDAAATAKVEQILRQHLARGAAILVVTHDLAQAERLTARTFEMASGRLASSRTDAVPGSGLEQ